jgi:diguanylate cyclase (GGDEF)-like protein/PAS domain S-box-containing protein
MTLDLNGNVMEWNQQSTEIFGFTAAEALLKPVVSLIVEPKMRSRARKHFSEHTKIGGNTGPVEWRVFRKDKTPIWILSSTLPLYNPVGEVVGIISSNVDITERKNAQAALQETQECVREQNDLLEKANDRLAMLATTDGLTGLKNHRAFQDTFDQEFTNSVKDNQDLSIILLDVDRFKLFNDEFGHQAGDAVLKGVAELLAVLSDDSRYCVARYGGEEFVILLPGYPLEKALQLAEKYRLAISNGPWPYRRVTASFGVASRTAETMDRSDLMRLADEAMYQSKSLGRDLVCCSQLPAPTKAAA